MQGYLSDTINKDGARLPGRTIRRPQFTICFKTRRLKKVIHKWYDEIPASWSRGILRKLEDIFEKFPQVVNIYGSELYSTEKRGLRWILHIDQPVKK